MRDIKQNCKMKQFTFRPVTNNQPFWIKLKGFLTRNDALDVIEQFTQLINDQKEHNSKVVVTCKHIGLGSRSTTKSEPSIVL